MIEVFRLIALSGQAVDYCRYLSYYMSKEGHLYVFQCWKALLKYFEQQKHELIIHLVWSLGTRESFNLYFGIWWIHTEIFSLNLTFYYDSIVKLLLFFFYVLIIKFDLRRCSLWGWCSSYLSVVRCQAHWERIVQSFSAPSKPVTFLFLSYKWRQVLGAKARRVGWILPQGRTQKKKKKRMCALLEQKTNSGDHYCDY